MNAQSDETTSLDLELHRVVAAARDSLTDEMVTRLAATAGETIALLDQVNRAGLARALAVAPCADPAADEALAARGVAFFFLVSFDALLAYAAAPWV